jgi:hypothetical protein
MEVHDGGGPALEEALALLRKAGFEAAVAEQAQDLHGSSLFNVYAVRQVL